MSAPDQYQSASDEKCYRPRRFYLGLSVACGVFFVAIGVTSTLAAYTNADGSFSHSPLLSPVQFAWIFGVFWSGWTLASIWNIVAYFRERLFLTSRSIRQVGVLRTRAIEIKDATRLKWRNWPAGGSIVVRTSSESVKIYFGNFTAIEREELIYFFREAVAYEIQENWITFEAAPPRRSPPGKLTSRGGIIAISLTLMCYGAAFFYCWRAGAGVQSLIVGIACGIAGLGNLLRLRAPQSLGCRLETLDLRDVQVF